MAFLIAARLTLAPDELNRITAQTSRASLSFNRQLELSPGRSLRNRT